MTPPDNPTSSGRQGDADRTSLFRPAADGSDHSTSSGPRTAVDEPSADRAGTDDAGAGGTGDSSKGDSSGTQTAGTQAQSGSSAGSRPTSGESTKAGSSSTGSSAADTSAGTSPTGSSAGGGSSEGSANGTADESTMRVAAGSGATGESWPAGAPTDSGSAPPPWQRVPADLTGQSTERSHTPAGESGFPYSTETPGGHHGLGEPSAHQPTLNLGSTPSRPVVTGRAAPQQSTDAPTTMNRPLGGFTGTQASASGPSSVSARRPGRGPRRASLQVKRVDPWSVLKLALVLSVALFFVWLVAVGVLYGVLSGMGVWDKLNGTYNELTQAGSTTGDQLISAGRVFSIAAIIGVVNIVLFTALATLAAFIYNVSSDLVGGIEVTLSERE